jgi:glycosyltransferase involved in cell wall biosynthesis
MNDPVLVSIIIPAFNRVAPLVQTLASARTACATLGAPAEIILVDDGSEPPLVNVLPDLATDPLITVLRQPNQGSIIGRLTGLAAARGEFVLFLDSDDLIAPAKLLLHTRALRTNAADVSYDDIGALTDPADTSSPIRTTQALASAADLPDLLLRVQPPPHGCIFRRDYLREALACPIIASERSLDAVGDIWLYYNLAVHPAVSVKIDEPLSLIGVHDQERYSQSWERLGCAALRLAERFMAATSHLSDYSVLRARLLAGECAFDSWRRLPRGFAPEYRRRILNIWREAPHGPHARLGGPLFSALATLLGPVAAGGLLRLRNAPYARSRTVDDATLARLLNP